MRAFKDINIREFLEKKVQVKNELTSNPYHLMEMIEGLTEGFPLLEVFFKEAMDQIEDGAPKKEINETVHQLYSLTTIYLLLNDSNHNNEPSTKKSTAKGFKDIRSEEYFEIMHDFCKEHCSSPNHFIEVSEHYFEKFPLLKDLHKMVALMIREKSSEENINEIIFYYYSLTTVYILMNENKYNE